MRKFLAAALLLLIGSMIPARAAEPPVTMGVINIQAATAIYLAADKGYFRDVGVDVRVEPIESTGSSMTLLASNRMQLLVGGLSAAYWNALSKDLPMILAFGTAASPAFATLLLRPDLVGVVKSPADLKGKIVAANAPGVIPVYWLAKTLEESNLTLHDVDLRYIPLPQMGIALDNHAIDAALASPPWGNIAIQRKNGVMWINFDDTIKPQPTVLGAFQANSDWIKQNRDQARRLFLAIGKASREYCQAYHHGPNREEVEDVMIKYKLVRDRESADSMPWASRDPNGRLPAASIEDIQDVFYREHMIEQKFPTSRLVDPSFAEETAKALGPFELVNKDSKELGCR